MTQLVLEEIQSSGKRDVGCLESGDVVVGREPGEGIAIDNKAISRSHGVFTRFKNHWLYKDLGSTNGSWLNGLKLKAAYWRVVRPGDVIADLFDAVRIAQIDHADSGETLEVLAVFTHR